MPILSLKILIQVSCPNRRFLLLLHTLYCKYFCCRPALLLITTHQLAEAVGLCQWANGVVKPRVSDVPRMVPWVIHWIIFRLVDSSINCRLWVDGFLDCESYLFQLATRNIHPSTMSKTCLTPHTYYLYYEHWIYENKSELCHSDWSGLPLHCVEPRQIGSKCIQYSSNSF